MGRILGCLLVLVTIGGTACGTTEPGSGEARLTVGAAGVAEVGGPGGWEPARDGSMLADGTRLRVVRGEVRLSGGDGLVMGLRAGGEIRLGAEPELTAGRLLVETGGGRLTVAMAGSTFSAARDTSARLSRSLAAEAAVYRGRVTVESAERTLTVTALRSVALPALGLVPARPSPIVADPADPWDERFLGLAMDLTNQLEAGSAGFTAQAPRVGASDVLALLPELPFDAAAARELRARRPGEQLVAASIAALADGPLPDRLGRVFAFYDQGASWGLVVLDQGLATPDLIVGVVGGAIGRWASASRPFASADLPPAGPAPPAPGAQPAPATPAPTSVPAAPSRPPTTSSPPTTHPAPRGLVGGLVAELPPTGTPVDDVAAVLRGVTGAAGELPLLSGGG